MKNIIQGSCCGNHTVEKYRFKILGSSEASQVTEIESEDTMTINAPDQENQDIKAQPKMVEKESQKESFIEDLLKKTDQLSSNIVKLQMQMETQQEEFKQRIENERKSAYEDGFKEGQEDTKKDYESKYNEIKDRFSKSIGQLDQEHKKLNEFLEKTKQELVSSSVEIAKEIIKKDIDQNSQEVALALSKSLMQDIKESSKISLKVNPKDYEFIKSSYQGDTIVEVSSDDAIAEGGVVLLSDLGNIDGTISTRVEKAKQLIYE